MKLVNLGANVTELVTGNRSILVSYETPVALHIEGVGYIVTEKKWSRTTSKHINQFLGGDKPHKTEPQEYFDALLENA
jgi:hypothetical protein